MSYLLGDIFIGNFPMTQPFGANPASYKRFGLIAHNGQDWGTPTGTQIVSTADGKVTEVATDPSGYGLYVKVVHSGFLTIYCHLQSQKVKVGDQVVQGQLIGISDNTGNSSGPHLHFGVAPCDSNGNKTESTNGYAGYIDPNSSRCKWEIKNLSKPNTVTSSNPQPPTNMDSTKARFFDLIWQAENGTNVDTNKVTEDQVNAYIEGVKSNKGRAGKWDQACIKKGLTGDSNQVTVDQLLAGASGSELQDLKAIRVIADKY